MCYSSVGILVSKKSKQSKEGALKGLQMNEAMIISLWTKALQWNPGVFTARRCGRGNASGKTWFPCIFQLSIWILLQKHSHARSPPLVTASQIALSPMVLLLVTASRLFSRPLLILLCCLISKDLPYPGSQSQLLLVCMHSPSFSYRVFFFIFLFSVRRQKNQEHFYMIKDLCRAS